jgi:hypothetical protein
VPSGNGSLLGRGLPPPPQSQDARAAAGEQNSFEPDEVTAVTPSMDEARALQQELLSQNITIKRRYALKHLGLVISVLRIPPEYDVPATVDSLRNAYSRLWIDANHRYQLQGSDRDIRRYAQRMVGWPEPATECGRDVRVGLIDGAVDTSHPSLTGQQVARRSFLSAGVPAAPADHGTAIAALLVGRADSGDFAGLLPAAKLYAAGVFRQRDGEYVETTSEVIIRALDWLAGEQVGVINLSLGGPRNLVVELVLQEVMDKGIAVVAAAGNNGQDGPPTWPAAQHGVVAVTAVDAGRKPYRKASRGDYIDFAAPGVDIWTASPEGSGKYRSGTSFAAPFVTALLANSQGQGGLALDVLRKGAVDLGVAGRDPVFGWGLTRFPGGCPG